MSAGKRDLVSIDDLHDETLIGLMDLADRIRRNLRGHAADLPGTLLGSLFLEPSTRTRLSFEAAMMRLGGRVITSSDPGSSSSVKGETLSDTVRIVDSYVDMLVLRHPAAGAARAAARLARGPVINAGDGSREHPTQTLCDLYALRCERGRISGLTVVLYGDLRYGRTTHSLVKALVRFGASVVAIAQGGLQLPDPVVEDLARARGYAVQNVDVTGLEAVFLRPRVSALWIAPPAEQPASRQLRLDERRVDAIYVTRLQRERLPSGQSVEALPILDHRFLAAGPFRDTVVLHPLPRVREIAQEFDRDPRAAYFRQAALGVPIRMALLLWVAGAVDLGGTVPPEPEARSDPGLTCRNPGCITAMEPGSVPLEFTDLPGAGPRCAYCEERAETVGGEAAQS
jgi:aspartate carbamoyltransferase catalytic subunit